MWMGAGCFWFGAGVPFWNVQEEEVEVDYRKYLGPDWKPGKKEHAGVICNHQSWVDIFVNMYTEHGSHVSKAAVKKFPFVGTCATMFGCLFIERDDKDKKRDMFTQIAER